MARKDLSRTVIEGGRYYSNCYLRRASHGTQRANTREWLDRVVVDVDEADATDPPPLRRVGKMFRDKLGPAQRWLLAQVGRPWNAVNADLCEKFDTRTVAGRHVVHDHMLQWVRHYDVPAQYRSRFELLIDAQGILRKPAFFGLSWKKLRAKALAWAQNRVAALTCRGWYWFRRQGVGAVCLRPWQCSHAKHFEVPNGDFRSAYHKVQLIPDRALTRGELTYLDRLPVEMRTQLVIESPWA